MADKNAKNNENRKKLNNILREPLTKYRVELNAIFRAAQMGVPNVSFSMEDLKKFISRIPNQDKSFKEEVQNMLQALQSGKAPKTPKVNTPALQLLWGAGFTFIALNPQHMEENWDNPVPYNELEQSKLWQQITKSSYAIQELISHSKNIEEVLRDRKTAYKWGRPGTGVSYDNKANKISVDFRHCLVVGFEHARADVCREIGYAYLSRSYPDRMVKLYQTMAPLLMKKRRAVMKKGPELTKAEYKSLRMLSAEWELRMKMFKAAEANVSNRYVDNLGKVRIQDFGVSLNNSAVTSDGIGFMPPAEAGKNMSEDMARYLNLCQAVHLSFFQNNGLFENTDDAWRKAGVDTKQIRAIKTLKSANDPNKDAGVAHPDFKTLRELCGGKDGLENQQPKHHERLYGTDVIERKIKLADKNRNKIIDYIWDSYAEDLIKNILEYTSDLIDEELENNPQDEQDSSNDHLQNPNSPPQPQDPQQGDPQQGDPQQGDPQQGEPQQGDPQQGEPQQGDPQQGEPQQGEPQQGDPQQGEPQQGEPQQGDPQQGDPQQGDPQQGDPQQGEPQQGDPQQGDPQQGDPQQGDPQQGEQQNGKPEESSLGKNEDSTVPVEDTGDMPDVESPSSSPQQEMSQDGNEQSQNGQGGENSDSLEDLKEQLEQMRDNLENLDELTDPSQMPEDQKEQLKEQLSEMQDQLQEMIDELQQEIDEQKQKQDAQQNGQDSQDGQDGQDGQDSATADELQQQMQDAQANEAAEGQQEQDGQDSQDGQDGNDSDSQSNDNKPSDQAGHQKGKSLSELAKQDWTEYSKRVAELRGPIMQTRKMFKRVQEMQLQKKKKRSAKMDILPQDGELMDRFNLEAHMNLTLKKAVGNVEENDLKRFHLDENFDVPTEIDILIMVDGSGSMGHAYGNTGASPLESALQSAAILYEATAGKDMKMNVYVGMWGNDAPPIIIEPGDNRKKIGQAMQAARTGLHSGTDLAPAIKKVAETMSDHHGKSNTLAGFTHVLIISDGDIGDESAARKNIETAFKFSDKITFDVAILKLRNNSQMENMAKRHKNKKPQHKIGYVIENKGDAVPMSIVGLLLNKIRKCGSFTAVPHSKKRRDMKKAANEMKKNKGGGRRYW